MMKPIYLDIMLGDRFVCQLRYTKRGWPRMVNGKMVETHSAKDIEEFVYAKRPSLRGMDIDIRFSDQRV